MKLLCTMPGKYGDILWSLLTCRALAEIVGEPVDLTVSGKYGSETFCRLLQAQPYIAAVSADPAWVIEERGPAPMNWEPPAVPPGYDHVIHMGYRDWPAQGLPFHIAETVGLLYGFGARQGLKERIAPERPWVSVEELQLPRRDWFAVPLGSRTYHQIAVGFSDDWFELKYGLANLLEGHDRDWDIEVVSAGPRWVNEGGAGGHHWIEAAQVLSQAEVMVACNCGLHVLGVAMGVPTIVIEPSEARWNRIFWPLGDGGPLVYGVRGNDGKPTFDARHLCDVVQQVLDEVDERRVRA